MNGNFAAKVAPVIFALVSSTGVLAQDGFRIYPYLQHPGPDAISVLWFSERPEPGTLSFQKRGQGTPFSLESVPAAADELAYSTWEATAYFDGEAPSIPFRHRIRIEGLEAGTEYDYTVVQGPDQFSASFRTAPDGNDSIRFIIYADSETEPESTGKFAVWADPVTMLMRSYLVDQTTGYRNNLEVIRSRQPDLVLMAGDLVQYGGVQRDWDEFWWHNTDSVSTNSLAGRVPLLPAPGNHEYYEGPELDQYNQPGSERAIRRYLAYFETPANGSPDQEQEGRYYAVRYGPATFIILDLCNNGTNGTDEDTNFNLLGESDPDGGHAPDFSEGSVQYLWLEEQLAEEQQRSLFTFLVFHHAPYSSGPHGFPPGLSDTTNEQSGVPVRALTPLLLRYGVDAVFSGHDEMWERSEVTGYEILPDGTPVAHSIQFYDVGTGGDGLREPLDGTDNTFQQFLAHTSAPEVWEGDRLLEGGKHYGHLEVNIRPLDGRIWETVMDPVYIFPLFNEEDSAYIDYERRVYEDRVILTSSDSGSTGIDERVHRTSDSFKLYPNPFTDRISIAYYAQGSVEGTIVITDMMGREVRILRDLTRVTGIRTTLWDGRDDYGHELPPGPYFIKADGPIRISGIALKQ